MAGDDEVGGGFEWTEGKYGEELKEAKKSKMKTS